jgi:hypothetical protein
MKALRIITNPYTLIASFLIIIISGQHLGGFYLIYLMLALPHFAAYSVLAVSGIVLLIFTYHSRKIKSSIAEPLVNLVAASMLLASIFTFFFTDKEQYNFGTFYQLVPQITLTVFASIWLSFIVLNTMSAFKKFPISL